MIRRLLFAVGCLFGLSTLAVIAVAFFWLRQPQAQQEMVQQILDLDSFQDLVRQEILDGLKSEYQSQHHWGQQTERKEAQVRGHWSHPHLEKKTEQVNDGLWQRFVTTLVEPQQNLATRVEEVRTTADGVQFSLSVQARVQGRGQFERWRKGIKLFDVSSDAAATVNARIVCDVGIHREPGHLVDDVVLDPQVTAIDLELVDLDMQRIGKLGPEVSHELGDALRPTIAKELVHREPHMIERANASIHRHPERLRFSLDRFAASGWSKFETSVAGAPTGARQ